MYRNYLKIQFFLVLSAGFWAVSSVASIDPFTADQGPIVVGPGEIVSEEDGTLQTASVLGGFRVTVPVVSEEASGGASATIEVAGGEWLCDLDFPVVDPQESVGGCSTGYFRSVGPYFDFSSVDSIDIDILEVTGQPGLTALAVDASENSAQYINMSPTTGTLSVERSAFTQMPGEAVDWSNIDAIVFSTANQDGASARVRLGGISTTGSIGSGDQGPPPELPDDELADTASGTYYNPERDGEGCMLTREGDQATFLLTCYLYQAGAPAWIIGTGTLENGMIEFDDTVVTGGTGYGDNFDPEAVERLPFGEVRMSFDDCNHAEISLQPQIAGFVDFALPVERLVPVACQDGVPAPDTSVRIGSWFNPERDGEGFHLTSEGDGGLHLLTFYTYLDGEQLWLIGTSDSAGDTLVFDDMVITEGTGFGPEFDPEAVERTPFGTITMSFDDCNNAVISVEADLPGFPDLITPVERIIQGDCQP